MKQIELGEARFTNDGAEVQVNGQWCSVDSKWPVLREALCALKGPGGATHALNDTPHPDADDILFCNHWPLVELATRYWRMGNVDDAAWPPGAVEIIHDEAAAREAWIGHIEAVEAAEPLAA